MKKTIPFRQYLSSELSETELDQHTKDIVHEYFHEKDLKKNWKSILSKDHLVKTFDTIDDMPSFNVPLSQDNISTKKPKSQSVVKLLLLVLTICFMLFISLLLKNQKTIESTSPIATLIDDYFASPMQYRNTKGPNLNAERRQEAFGLYNIKEYSKASIIFDEIIQNQEFVEDDHFYLGLSYLYNKEPSKATEVFKYILEQDSLQRADSATWFLALSFIENQQFHEAEKYLHEVSQWSGNAGKLNKANQAKEILDLIKKQH